MPLPRWWTVLDPADWEKFRATAHGALDDAINRLRDIRDEPVWRPVPDEVKAALTGPMPEQPREFDDVYAEFKQNIWPYVTGNIHPRWFGWVHGSGTVQGAIAEMLAAFMNSNVGGREHSAVYVERQVIRWFTDLYGWPETASGILTTGTSIANLYGVLIARTKARPDVRREGLDQQTRPLVGYASSASHVSVTKAFEAAGLGSNALRLIPVDENHHIKLDALREAIAEDKRNGAQPFIIIGNAGTVDIGAIDPLNELAEIAREHALWYHVDGAFGAMVYLSDKLRHLVSGIERADSIAFDFHKWLHVPYDAGCLIAKDAAAHKATFAKEAKYLARARNGPGSGDPWFTDFGLDLSRSFRALKVWFAIQEHGKQKIASAIEANCELAQEFARMVGETEHYEIAAPVSLQIVCFRPVGRGTAVDECAMAIQTSGVSVISSTALGQRRVLRFCATNQRADLHDVRNLMYGLSGQRCLSPTIAPARTDNFT